VVWIQDRRRRPRGARALALAGLLLLGGCRAAEVPPPANTAVSATSSPSTAIAPAVAVGPESAPPRFKVMQGATWGVAQAGIFLAAERGYFAEEGIEPEFVPFDAGATITQAMIAGQIDMGWGQVNVAMLNAASRALEFKIVGPGNRHAVGASSYYLVARPDLVQGGALRDYADLRGKRVATPARQSSDYAFALALGKGGLDLEDVEYVEMGFPNMLAALSNAAVDVAMAAEPIAALGERGGVGVKWREAGHYASTMEWTIVTFGSRLTANPDAATRWWAAYLRGCRDYHEAMFRGYDREAVIDVLIRNTTLKDRAVYDQAGWSYLDPNGTLLLDSLADQLRFWAERGQAVPRLEDLVDTRFVRQALARVGEYAP
jgi:NitT/TauT family transport system substrate-binding protein